MKAGVKAGLVLAVDTWVRKSHSVPSLFPLGSSASEWVFAASHSVQIYQVFHKGPSLTLDTDKNHGLSNSYKHTSI